MHKNKLKESQTKHYRYSSITNKDSERRKKQKRTNKNNQETNFLNDNKYMPINNDVKCKWLKFSNQKT